jgi:hypothetical protein
MTADEYHSSILGARAYPDRKDTHDEKDTTRMNYYGMNAVSVQRGYAAARQFSADMRNPKQPGTANCVPILIDVDKSSYH